MKVLPTRDRERQIFDLGHQYVACIDEVGRGALAGPAVIGIVVVQSVMMDYPDGIRDSKLISARMREKLLPGIHSWAVDVSIGEASPAEIDRVGIMAALGLAAQRALENLNCQPDAILLDGNINYLTAVSRVPVFTEIKGDMNCVGIAAASIVAKCERDDYMRRLDVECPGYAFDSNKGYSSSAHIKALQIRGVSSHHRASWNLPGLIP